MRWSDIQFDPSRKTLRQFAGLCLVFFSGMAVWEILGRGHTGRGVVFAILALTIGPVGLIQPTWVRLIYVGWTVLVFPIGWTISLILLATIFFGLFAPVSLVFRLFGRDVLQRTRHPDQDSYWVPKPAPSDFRRYFQQF